MRGGRGMRAGGGRGAGGRAGGRENFSFDTDMGVF
jgi:hypothetical protein